MKFLSDHNCEISIIYRVVGTPEEGYMDLYRLFMRIGEECWALLILPSRIVHLQEYIEMGTEVFKRKFNYLNTRTNSKC